MKPENNHEANRHTLAEDTASTQRFRQPMAHPHLPDPENPLALSASPIFSESGCGILPQSAQGVSSARHDSSHDDRSEFSRPGSAAAPHPPAHSFDPNAYASQIPFEWTRPEETDDEPDYDYGYDPEEDARERKLLLDDLASDSDDFSRSDEEGWFYSDED